MPLIPHLQTPINPPSKPRLMLLGLTLLLNVGTITSLHSITSAQTQITSDTQQSRSTSAVPQLEGESSETNPQPALIGNTAVEAAARLRDIVQRIDPGAKLLANGASFRVEGVPVTLVYDINADRMRIMTAAASINDIDTDQLIRLMQANFDSALDARYALAQGVLWSTFIHPLSTLSSDEFGSGLGQTVNLITTFGSSYSSGALIYGGGDSNEQQRVLIEELQDKSKDI